MMKKCLPTLLACYSITLLGMEAPKTVPGIQLTAIEKEQYNLLKKKVDAVIYSLQVVAGQLDIEKLKDEAAKERLNDARKAFNGLSAQDKVQAVTLQVVSVLKEIKAFCFSQEAFIIRLLALAGRSDQQSMLLKIQNDISKVFETPFISSDKFNVNEQLNTELKAIDKQLRGVQDMAQSLTKEVESAQLISPYIHLCRGLINAYRLYVIEPNLPKIKSRWGAAGQILAAVGIASWAGYVIYNHAKDIPGLISGAKEEFAKRGYPLTKEPDLTTKATEYARKMATDTGLIEKETLLSMGWRNVKETYESLTGTGKAVVLLATIYGYMIVATAGHILSSAVTAPAKLINPGMEEEMVIQKTSAPAK